MLIGSFSHRKWMGRVLRYDNCVVAEFCQNAKSWVDHFAMTGLPMGNDAAFWSHYQFPFLVFLCLLLSFFWVHCKINDGV